MIRIPGDGVHYVSPWNNIFAGGNFVSQGDMFVRSVVQGGSLLLLTNRCAYGPVQH